MPTRRKVTPLCGLPSACLDDIPAGTIGAVLGAGLALGSPHEGAENAPFFLRTVSKTLTWSAQVPDLFDLRHAGAPLRGFVDVGDLDFTGMDLPQALVAVEEAVATLPPEVIPCVIGGDHTLSFAVAQALHRRRQRPFRVVQFDHHLDLQIWDGAPARPEAELEPVYHTNVMSHMSRLVGPSNLVQVGVSPYATVEASAIDAMPGYLRAVGEQICVTDPAIEDPDAFLSAVGKGADVYVTVDVDVLDRVEMRSTAYPAELGLRAHQLLRLVDRVAEHNRLIGFDVVEFGAERTDRDPQTLADSQRVLLIFLHLLSWVHRQSAERLRP